MGQQLTVRLSPDLAEQLERAAKRLRRKRSDVVRLALEEYLSPEGVERPIERVRDLLGQVESGIPDLGQRHREHVVKRLRHAR
ncbi:MAG: ribbon-helix-helix protein, CopG family [Chloroflexi bacterium]|nr:ribbon-helix-helix protein, CopG family [Chloroflexota bacterium]